MGLLALLFTIADAVLSFAYVMFDKDNRQVDWTSFTSQGESVLDGIYDYEKIWGPQGWIAYPAGSAWFYAFLNYTKISYSYRQSQYLWIALHALQTYVLAKIVEKTIKRKDLQILCMGLYLLQMKEKQLALALLQNDFIMIVLMEISVLFVIHNHMFLSILFFNLAFSIKAGVILWLPGYLLVLAKKRSMLCVVLFALFSGVFQIAIGWPFIQANLDAYLTQTLGLGRRVGLSAEPILYFLLPDDVYYSKEFAIGATILMLSVNALFLMCVWTNWRTFFSDIRLWPLSLKLGEISALEAVKIIYISAWIQATFSYQCHQQFLLWYTPVYPFLISISGLPLELQIPMMLFIDQGSYAKNSLYMKIGPAISHLILLYIFFTEKRNSSVSEKVDKKLKIN